MTTQTTAQKMLAQAASEVEKEKNDAILAKMKLKVRNLLAAKAVVKAIELEIDDLQQQIEDGTI